KHLDGMTAGHETNRQKIDSRLDYPDNHVEVDNRLVWFLGGLDKRYDDGNTFYVYLTFNGAPLNLLLSSHLTGQARNKEHY
ncbi:MAG: hypothetical protein R6T91_00500, partial [Bacteroidales bacterium]